MNTAVAGAAQTEVDDQGRVVVDGKALGYSLRYLDTAYASDANGADFAITPQGLPNGTTPVYQGVRNTSSTTQSTNPADFTWREINSPVLSQNLNAFYRSIGDRNIDWMFSSSATVAGFILDDGTAVIDLDSLPGAAGTDGNSAGNVEIFIRASIDTPPTTPSDTTDYNTADGTFTVPTNWSLTKAGTTGTDPIWSSTASFFGTGTATLDWSEPTRLEGTDVTVTDTDTGATIDDGVNEIDIDGPVGIRISPALFTLEADYTGDITSSSRTVTIEVTQGNATFTYDDTAPYADRTFRVHNVVNGSATVSTPATPNGTLIVSDTTVDEQVVSFDVSYVQNDGTAVTLNQSFTVLRMVNPRVLPEVTITPEVVTFDANYRGQVTPTNQTITVAVGDFTYDESDVGTAETFVITAVTSGAATATLPEVGSGDGTFVISDINDDAESATVVANVRYYDDIGQVYNVQRSVSVLKSAATREAPIPALDRNLVVLNANYFGTVLTGQSELVTVVMPSEYTYSPGTEELAVNAFRISIEGGSGAMVSNNDDGTVSVTSLGDALSTSVRLQVDYRDDVVLSAEAYQQVLTFTVEKNIATREVPMPMLNRSSVILNADHLGSVISNQSEVVTVSIAEYAYDNVGELDADSFVISAINDGGASVTNNNDGTVSVTNLPDNQATAIVDLTVRYRDSIVPLAAAFEQSLSFTVEKLLAAPPSITIESDPSSFIFENASRSTVQVATLSVLQDTTALTFTANTNLADGEWRISSIGATPNIGVSQPDTPDGSLRLANPSNDSGSFVVNVEAQDTFGETYSLRQRINYSQTYEVIPEIEITFSNDTTIVQNTDGTYSHSSVDVYFRVREGTSDVARAARQIDYNTSTGAFSINNTNPAHPDGNLNANLITVALVAGGEFQVEYTG